MAPMASMKSHRVRAASKKRLLEERAELNASMLENIISGRNSDGSQGILHHSARKGTTDATGRYQDIPAGRYTYQKGEHVFHIDMHQQTGHYGERNHTHFLKFHKKPCGEYMPFPQKTLIGGNDVGSVSDGEIMMIRQYLARQNKSDG